MRRTSLSPTQARQLGKTIRQRREQLGLSIRALEAASNVNISSIIALERGETMTPQPDTLKELAAALSVPVTDLFTVAGWLPVDELPTLKLYLRVKFRYLDSKALADLERYAEGITQRGATNGPQDREDEATD